MGFDNYFCDPGILNIFCDASITTIGKEYIGCPGCVVVQNIDGSSIIVDKSYTILRQSTNNNSEITALQLAVKKAVENKGKFKQINIFSDSQICVFGLTKWIYNWINGIQDGIMYSSSGEPVANQHVILNIVHMIIYNNLNINIYHQKGHVTSTSTNIAHAKDVFMKSNSISDISTDFIIKISYFNNFIDVYTKQILEATNLIDIDRIQVPITHLPNSKEDVIKYKNLIKKEI